MINTTGCSFLSLLSLQQKPKGIECNSAQMLLPQMAEPKVRIKKPVKQVNSLPIRPKISPLSSAESHSNVTESGPDKDEGEKYLFIDEDDKHAEKEDEILRQYLSLQQLAISRRHCNQLRRIRDSLGGKIPNVSKRPTPTKEQEELRNFLMDVGFVQYYVVLNRHGYNLETASHMNAFDLVAVGITEPLHRMALKYELDQVRHRIKPIESIPETIVEWLGDLSLSEYVENFQMNGIYCPLAAVGLTKRDLQIMGIYLLGHRKRISLALSAIGLTLSGKNTKQENSSEHS